MIDKLEGYKTIIAGYALSLIPIAQLLTEVMTDDVDTLFVAINAVGAAGGVIIHKLRRWSE